MMTFYSGACGLASAAGNPLLVLFIGDLFPPSMRASAVGLWQTSSQVSLVISLFYLFSKFQKKKL
jgi:MFS family permease